jgi:hypothetical protein
VSSGGRLTIADSRSYAAPPAFSVDAVTSGAALEVVIAAENGARPLLGASTEIALEIGARGRLILDGLVIEGAALRLAPAPDTEPRELVLRDCTLVPGLSLTPQGEPTLPGLPSLIVEHPFSKVTLERCITGALQVVADASVSLVDCIVDSGAPQNVAYAADADGAFGAELEVKGSTVIGKLATKVLHEGSNSIFLARLAESASETWAHPFTVERRQQGCLRFSFVPHGAVTPRRYRCIPDAAHPEALPYFTSLRYGEAAYCQLAQITDSAIRAGAEGQSEMGIGYALQQPLREANLRVRLDEYLRFGLSAGIFYAT